jgi:uncharacterized protein YciI
MYVVLLNYTAPLEEIDQAIPAHIEWLTRQYDEGHFLASGRQNPRTGGVIVARAMERGKLDEILAGDPFALKELAEYEVVEFLPTKTAPELRSLQVAVTS